MRYREPYYSDVVTDESFDGEPIEDKVTRILDNQEPIEQISPIIYTERSKGVEPQYDIRTDRFDIALNAMDKISKMRITKRMDRPAEEDGESKGESKSAEIKGVDETSSHTSV